MQQRGYATVLTNHSKQTDFPHHWVHCSSFLFFPHNYEYFLIWIFLFFTLLWYRYGIYMGQITQMEYENKQLQWQRILINNAELILNVEKYVTFSDFLKVGISFSGRSKGQVTNSLQRALIPTVPKKIPLRFWSMFARQRHTTAADLQCIHYMNLPFQNISKVLCFFEM